MFNYFDEFVAEYENRFERKYGYFRPVIQEVVEKYFDCGNPKCGFARIRCGDCWSEFLLHFSCHGRGFCPTCHAKCALNWTRLSCKQFISNQARLCLFVLAYNLGNFLRRLVLPGKIKRWSLRSLLVKLIKIGAKVLRHSRYVIFQMAEVAISKEIFAEILSRINRLRCCSV